jgi:pyridoxamine 5'-phosphate oxidase
MNLESIRREYQFAELSRTSVYKDPLKQLEKWISDALEANAKEATAMSVVNIGIDGFPQTRIVLLKKTDENGITFFTHYTSCKGKSIDRNNKVGLHFFWPELERQIRIAGYASKTSAEVSDKYFESRPRASQIAAIVSKQSQEIPSRESLENRYFDVQNKLKDQKTLKRPDSWGGYIVKPVKLEFWQGRESRLHDRIIYEKIEDQWKIKRLSP